MFTVRILPPRTRLLPLGLYLLRGNLVLLLWYHESNNIYFSFFLNCCHCFLALDVYSSLYLGGGDGAKLLLYY